MGLFGGRKKSAETASAPMQDVGPKKRPDKSIKERAPRSMVPKRIVRVFFWCFMCFIFIKGCVSFTQGTKVVHQTINYGSDKPVIDESIKGFAADFASEYFTWSDDNFSERSSRLAPFISNISQDAGLKSFDIKGSSRVLSAEVYDAKKINDSQVDVTVVVRREVTLPQDNMSSAGGPASVSAVSNTNMDRAVKKAYMVVPVTITDKGPVIRSYPRFVTELIKGETESQAPGPSITDTNILNMGKELTESFLRSWYDGNLSQLKYYYSDIANIPSSVTKSNFVFDKVDSLNMYKVDGQENVMRIYASIIVKSDIGESFTNSWTLDVTAKDGRLYILSVGDGGSSTNDSTSSSQATSESDQVTPQPTSSNE
ncbi:conjugal transfer protein [Thermobacillus composti]|uniref:conjugal transfer protein n=1 Tax=Thermobacillus composti TaxID=377615 RepID=UPI00031488DA|nr:conjugal transfer protein [Thermobacillus composti]